MTTLSMANHVLGMFQLSPSEKSYALICPPSARKVPVRTMRVLICFRLLCPVCSFLSDDRCFDKRRRRESLFCRRCEQQRVKKPYEIKRFLLSFSIETYFLCHFNVRLLKNFVSEGTNHGLYLQIRVHEIG